MLAKIRLAIVLLMVTALSVVLSPTTTAATTVMQAETLTWDPAYSGVKPDTAASGGQTLMVWGTGTIWFTKNTNIASLTVRARGSQCQGAPNLRLKLDNTVIGSKEVTSTSYADYTWTLNAPAGNHSVFLAFTNDFTAAGCDRNLFMDTVTIETSATPTTTTAPPPPPTTTTPPTTPSTTPPPTTTTPPPPVGSVLWQDKLDTATNGQLTKATADPVFGPTMVGTDNSTFANGSVVDDGANGKFLRHNIPANSLGPFIVLPRLSHETDWATISYDLRFDPNFDWQMGGKMGPALIGAAPGHDIFEPTSCGARTGQSFSTRLMWHGNKPGAGRPYQEVLGPIPPGSNDIVTYTYALSPYRDNCGFSASMGPMSKGAWHNIKSEVKLNTVGQNNGILRVWIDGVLKYQNTACNFRNVNTLHIQAVIWDIHRGGDLPDWGSPQADQIDIRNVVVTDLM